MKYKPLLSIVIVSFNAKDLVDDCLQSLLKQDYQPIEIIFVINGSTDGTEEYVKTNYSTVNLISNKENIGFGPAANLGIKQAKGVYLWIYNDDAICDKDSLVPLVNALEKDPKLAACQGTLIRLPEKTIESMGSFFSITGILYRPLREVKINSKREIFSANLPVIKTSVLKEIGVFDTDYFLYFEEADLCWRIWQAGYTIKYIPESKLYHKPCSTTSKLPSEMVIYESFKNRINSLIKNLQFSRLLFILPLHLFLVTLAAAYLLLRLNFKNCGAIVKAVLWNLKVLDNTLKKRKLVAEKRKTSDREIFAKVEKPLDFDYYLVTAWDYFSQW